MQKKLFLAPAALILFILYFTVFGERGLLRINHLQRDRDEMQRRYQELKGENDRLRREITALQSDRRYLESIARREFGLVRSNEVIYQFPSAAAGTQNAKPAAKSPADKQPPAPAERKAAQPAAAPH
jgi:cell division protein FtsB